MVDYSGDVEKVKNYYSDLLILQYRQKPRARQTIGLYAQLYLADGLIFQLNDCLNIDIAEGVQLDLIGKILGVDRKVQGLVIDRDFFSFEKQNALGFSTVGALGDGEFKTLQRSKFSVYSLNDADYRTVLKFKARYNLRLGSMASIDDLLFDFFGTDIKMVNNKNLSVTFNIYNTSNLALAAVVALGYIKPPAGIGYNYVYI